MSRIAYDHRFAGAEPASQRFHRYCLSISGRILTMRIRRFS
ncbi:MAG: hypothetical protein ACT6RN_23090 [Agrobacterium sp.]